MFAKAPDPKRTDDVKRGQRVFDILANEKVVCEDFDISKSTAINRPQVFAFSSKVTDAGELTIELQPAKGSLPPIISGIEVIRTR